MSKEKNRRPVVVGIFIFIGIVILVLTVLLLGGQRQTFEKAFPISATFEDVGGLKAGDNVWLAGVKVGVVKKVSFTDSTAVMVTMNIQKDEAQYIRRDAKAKLGSDGLMGSKVVIIYGGTSTAPQIAKGDQLFVDKAYGPKDMLAILDSSNRNLLVISTNMKAITGKVLEGNGTIGTLLNDPNIPRDLKASVADIKSTLAHFKETSVQSQKAIENFTQFSSQLNAQGTLLNDLVTDTVIYNNLRSSISQLRETMYNVGEFADNLQRAGEQLNSNDNPAGVLLNDKQVAGQLKSVVRNLDSASHKLDEDLEAVQHNFLLRGYFKKKEKQQQP